jgi:hypothetical protein
MKSGHLRDGDIKRSLAQHPHCTDEILQNQTDETRVLSGDSALDTSFAWFSSPSFSDNIPPSSVIVTDQMTRKPLDFKLEERILVLVARARKMFLAVCLVARFSLSSVDMADVFGQRSEGHFCYCGSDCFLKAFGS